MNETKTPKYKALPPVDASLEIKKERVLVPSKHIDQANSSIVEKKGSVITGGELLNMMLADKDKNILNIVTDNFLYSDFTSQEDLESDKEKILNSQIFKTYTEKTKKLQEKKTWTPMEATSFLHEVNENNFEVYKFFDTLNDELDRDLMIWQEDLKEINLQMDLWNVAGISMDVAITETKMNIARKWLTLKEQDILESIKKINSVKKSIKDSIRKFCNEKETI
ncbi:uncharacterized protein HGUI_03252 [Hanseniaspora guilliermondii]|uniref:Uncharacterized protein n=1 Tax=Hanseniaspora guilliermondii TaxID=56406 RepID=A0A1L0B5F1_9ASCO|nr:uncharacterized protein HGUI_03252 [Hanseniaspora guilliermondii]